MNLPSPLSLAAHRAEVDWFPYWCFLITAPFLYVATFLHLLIGRWYTGIFVSYKTDVENSGITVMTVTGNHAAD